MGAIKLRTSITYLYYSKCYLEDLIIAFGRTINSFSGGFNTAATVVIQGFQIFSLDGEVAAATETDADYAKYSYGLKMIRLVDDTERPNVTDNAIEFGKLLGKVFTKFFNVQVPDVQYQSYN
jgi:hypothetical protein